MRSKPRIMCYNERNGENEMKNDFINTKRSLTNDDLKQFESKFNVVMPDKIKKHYLKYNGGYPERNIFKLDGNDREYAVNYFFSIGCEGGKTIEKFGQ